MSQSLFGVPDRRMESLLIIALDISRPHLPARRIRRLHRPASLLDLITDSFNHFVGQRLAPNRQQELRLFAVVNQQ